MILRYLAMWNVVGRLSSDRIRWYRTELLPVHWDIPLSRYSLRVHVMLFRLCNFIGRLRLCHSLIVHSSLLIWVGCLDDLSLLYLPVGVFPWLFADSCCIHCEMTELVWKEVASHWFSLVANANDNLQIDALFWPIRCILLSPWVRAAEQTKNCLSGIQDSFVNVTSFCFIRVRFNFAAFRRLSCGTDCG